MARLLLLVNSVFLLLFASDMFLVGASKCAIFVCSFLSTIFCIVFTYFLPATVSH